MDEKPPNITKPFAYDFIERIKKVRTSSEYQQNGPKYHLNVGDKFTHIVNNPGFSPYEGKLLNIEDLSKDNQWDPYQEKH